MALSYIDLGIPGGEIQLLVLNNGVPYGIQNAQGLTLFGAATVSSVSGTANQVAATAGPAVTLSLPNALVAPGSLEVTTFLQMDGLQKQPFTPVAVANGATINLSATKSLNVLRPTGDATIAGAVINLPAAPTDGQICTVTSSANITTVTGTISTLPVPALVSMQAGQRRSYGWNATAGLWLTV